MTLVAMTFGELMARGGYVMWPLLALSVLGVALVLERAWFFARTNSGARLKGVERMTAMLRRGEREAAQRVAAADSSVYGDVASGLLDGQQRVTDAAAVDAIEGQRRRLERFMPLLSTIITAAPMLGILGTVLGIIGAFEALGDAELLAAGTETRMSAVGEEIAKALITTAAGLIIAVVILFPYNALRSQVDRTLSRLESLVAAAVEGAGGHGAGTTGPGGGQ